MNRVLLALIAGGFTWFITLLGALSVFFFKKINNKFLCKALAFSAGVMVSSSFWSLLLPAFEMLKDINFFSVLSIVFGLSLGIIFVYISDILMDKFSKRDNKKNILLALAMTIHNIPEGFVIGVASAGIGNGFNYVPFIMLTLGIAIQNFPEGMCVSLPLRSSGSSKFKSFFIGQISAFVEPISAVIGALFIVHIKILLPVFLSFAAGAMLVVSLRELILESFSINKNSGTFYFFIGFIILMFLDMLFGC